MTRRRAAQTEREPPPPPPAPERYRAWAAHVFDRPETPWYFPADPMEDIAFPNADADELAALVTHTMATCGEDLAPFSDAQIAHGLNFMTNNACGDVVMEVMRPTLSLARRRTLIASLKTLYTDCFAPRCARALSHTSDPIAAENPLNVVCYMFWDASPLLHWSGDGADALNETVLDVLEATLAIDHPAVQESALHGLGHIRQHDRTNPRPERIIQTFLKTTPTSPTLRAYTEAAAAGCVQ